jgi:hypothetical protein
MQKRIALIVCYYGKFPEWIDIWLKSCEFNKEYDFFLVTDNNSLKEVPQNVKVIYQTMNDLKVKLSKAAGFEVVLRTPYKLCDYKPLYGKALEEYLVEYDFWGHCDLDLIWGRLSNFLTDDIFDKYDLIGMYGHLMIYRNTDYMNSIFKLDGGVFGYKEVFLHADNFSFDEMSGIDLIAQRNRISHYKRLKIANMSPNYKRFKISSMKSEKEYFIWEKGKVLRIYGIKGNLVEEFAYIHFSGKKPTVQLSQESIKNANIYLSSKNITERKTCELNELELMEHNEYVSNKEDKKTLKKFKKNKIKEIIHKSIPQKIIWLKVHKGIWKFNCYNKH